MPADDTRAEHPGAPVQPEKQGARGDQEHQGTPDYQGSPDEQGAPDDQGAPEGTAASGARGGPEDQRASEDRRSPEDAGAPAPEDITARDPVSAPDAEGRPRRVTRRFPLFTRDTARPEGGGRAAAGDAPAPARQWPILLVVVLVGTGLLLTALDVFRYGTLLIGAALLVGAALRWVLPDVGMLAVRSRFTDISTYGVLGLSIVLLALMTQPNPVLEIPFLKDTLHFTVS
nr:DUF3017 domain-containing protein [Streptomyces pactum]